MTKKEDTLAALLQIKRALSQGRDIASSALGQMIKRVQDGEALTPNPVVERAARKPMDPMITKPKPAPEPVKEPEPEVVDAAEEVVDEPDEKENTA